MKKIFLILIALFISGCNPTKEEADCYEGTYTYNDLVNGIIVDHNGTKMFYTDSSYGEVDRDQNVHSDVIYNGYYSIDFAIDGGMSTNKYIDSETIIMNLDEVEINVECVAYFIVGYPKNQCKLCDMYEIGTIRRIIIVHY